MPTHRTKTHSKSYLVRNYSHLVLSVERNVQRKLDVVSGCEQYHRHDTQVYVCMSVAVLTQQYLKLGHEKTILYFAILHKEEKKVRDITIGKFNT